MAKKKSRVFEDIISNHKITDYLQKRGIPPVSTTGPRSRYICPLHGPEKAPSFYVFDDDGSQHYHCFGCRAHGDIIDIKVALESRSKGDVIYELADGVEFGDAARLNDEEAELRNALLEARKRQNLNTIDDLGEISYHLSRSMHDYLEAVGYDKEEAEFLDGVSEKIDGVVHAMDLTALQVLKDAIPDKLKERAKFVYRKREKEMAKKYHKRATFER